MAKTRSRGNVPKQAVVAQRLQRVYELSRDGYRFTRAYSIVTLEAAEEAKAKASKETEKPPEVWGASGKVARKTFARYWKRAHTRLIEDGQKLVKQGDLILSKNFSRQDGLYTRALEAGQFGVCRRLIVDQLMLFGLFGAVKVQLSSALDAGGPEEQPDIGQAERTLPELLDAQFAILNSARVRAGHAPLPNPAKLKIEAGGKR